jgi:hypothetical protein
MPCLIDDQRGTTSEAPPFASIGKNRGSTPAIPGKRSQFAMFLLDPHPKMPNMSLTRIKAADLAASIAALGK